MASQLIHTVLDAESEAAKRLQEMNERATGFINYTKTKAEACLEQSRADAQLEADKIIKQAETDATGFIAQAEKLADMRSKKLIGETESKYEKAISAVISHITGQ